MNPLLAINLYMLICCGFGLVYGIIHLNAKKKPPIYFHFGVLSVFSAFLSRIFYCLSIAFYGGLPETFNIGFIGYAAVFLFLIFANFGQIDMLADDRKTVKARYRLFPVIIPIIEIIPAIFGLFVPYLKISIRISYCIISILAGFAGYFHTKHIFIPDVDFGIVKMIRGYSIIELFIGILSLAEIGLSVYGLTDIILYIQIALGALYAVNIPILSSEVRKWTT